MKLNELVTVTTLPKEENIKLALKEGKPFQYKKEGVTNYLFHNGSPMCFLTTLEFVAGKERGNHYHNKKEESLLVAGGVLKGKYWLPNDLKEILEIVLNPGDIVNIKPGVAHAYISDEGATAIEFSPQVLDISDQIDI